MYRHIGVDGVARENWLKLGGVRRLWWLQGRGRVAAATRMSQFSPQPEGPGPILPISASLLARRQPVSVVRRSSISTKIGSRRRHPYYVDTTLGRGMEWGQRRAASVSVLLPPFPDVTAPPVITSPVVAPPELNKPEGYSSELPGVVRILRGKNCSSAFR